MSYDEGFIINQDRPSDEGVRAEFYTDAVINGLESKRVGRPVYKEVEFVRISVVGDKTSTICHRVTDEHRKRFPNEYQKFRNSIQSDDVVGTPLKLWPALSIAKVREFADAGIKTVEQLSKANAERLGGDAGIWIEKAKEWLMGPSEMAEEIRRLKAELESLKAAKSNPKARRVA